MPVRVAHPSNKYQASLVVASEKGIMGDDERGSAKKQRQEVYRRELQQQIEIARDAKKKEKDYMNWKDEDRAKLEEKGLTSPGRPNRASYDRELLSDYEVSLERRYLDLKSKIQKDNRLDVNITGFVDPEKAPDRLRGLGDPNVYITDRTRRGGIGAPRYPSEQSPKKPVTNEEVQTMPEPPVKHQIQVLVRRPRFDDDRVPEPAVEIYPAQAQPQVPYQPAGPPLPPRHPPVPPPPPPQIIILRRPRYSEDARSPYDLPKVDLPREAPKVELVNEWSQTNQLRNVNEEVQTYPVRSVNEAVQTVPIQTRLPTPPPPPPPQPQPPPPPPPPPARPYQPPPPPPEIIFVSPRQERDDGRRSYRASWAPNNAPLDPRLSDDTRAMDRLKFMDRGGGGGGQDGILGAGWGNLLDSGRRLGSVGVPPGVQYQPASYITAGARGGADDAYNYYGARNILDGDGNARAVPNLNLYNVGPSGHSPRPTFDEALTTRRKQERTKQPLQFNPDDDKRAKVAIAEAYQEDLMRQILEQKRQKERQRAEQEAYDRRKEEEIKHFEPFGRGGGGAPNRDQHGNIKTDLRIMHNEADTYRHPPPQPGSPKRSDVVKTPTIQTTAWGEPTHARGGHGIFGVPRTDFEKNNADRYKMDLMIQIEEKRRLAEMEKEKQRAEEEKENKRLQDQRDKIQREFEEEKRRAKEKDDEVRRKNEELLRQAEEKKKEMERKRKEADEKHSRELQQQQERERLERERERNVEKRETSSPPLPAANSQKADNPIVKEKSAKAKEEQATPSPEPPDEPVEAQQLPRSNSPPIPTVINQERVRAAGAPDGAPRTTSATVLNQLSRMREQLQSESRRVQSELERQKNQPEVFDIRLMQRPPPPPTKQLALPSPEPKTDAFDDARNRKPVYVERPPRTSGDDVDPNNLRVFNRYKHAEKSASRRDFRSLYPDAPNTNSALDIQQQALLRQQENSLDHLRHNKSLFDHMSPKDLGLVRRDTISPQAMLQSNSAFIDVSPRGFPDDFDDFPRRNESARSRRRAKYDLSPRPDSQPLRFGSQASLDVDRIARTNEERLKKLHEMTDEVSLYDADEILDRFMSKQTHSSYRPPSGQSRATLQDDTWLRPYSRR